MPTEYLRPDPVDRDDLMREIIITYTMYMAARQLWNELATHNHLAQHPNGPELMLSLRTTGEALGRDYREGLKTLLNDQTASDDWLWGPTRGKKG
jgi:hypothetical protein